jgi:hypothetical protein
VVLVQQVAVPTVAQVALQHIHLCLQQVGEVVLPHLLLLRKQALKAQEVVAEQREIQLLLQVVQAVLMLRQHHGL